MDIVYIEIPNNGVVTFLIGLIKHLSGDML